MKTRVLYLLNDFTDASINRRALNLVNELDVDRYNFHINCVKQIHGPLESHFMRAGANVIFFDHPLKTIGIASKIVEYVRENDINIIHAHNLRADVIGGMTSLVSGQVILISTKCNMSYMPGQRDWLLKNVFYWPVIFLPDHVITVSEDLRQQFISRLRINPNKVSTIYTGIDLEKYFQPDSRNEIRNQFGHSPEEIILTYVGRLIEGKDLDGLLTSASIVLSQYKEVNFLFVGDGPHMSSLKTHAKKLGIQSKVTFTGFRKDIPKILAASDIFVFPSIREGLPQSLIEAMAAGKPVVTTNAGGILEIVEPNVSGLVVPPHDPDLFAKAICTLIEQKDLREELAKNGKTFVNQRFKLETMVNEYDRLYRSCLDNSLFKNTKILKSKSSENIQ